MKKKLLIIGSGGHAKSCIDVIEGIKNVKIINSYGSRNINDYIILEKKLYTNFFFHS